MTRTYILTWNGKTTPWQGFRRHVEATYKGRPVSIRWSSGNNKSIKKGDRLFMLRQRLDRGLVAAGYATSDCFPDQHWDDNREGEALYVRLRLDTLLELENVLPISRLQGSVRRVPWNTMYASGTQVHDAAIPALERVWAEHLAKIGRFVKHRATATTQAVDASLDEDLEEFPEGREAYRLHRTRERNPKIVDAVKRRARKAGALNCIICGFDFEKVYGEPGEGFIECHHTVPISEYSKGQKTRMTDIALVCANCHRMLHRRRPWLKIEELSALLHKPRR